MTPVRDKVSASGRVREGDVILVRFFLSCNNKYTTAILFLYFPRDHQSSVEPLKYE